MGGHYRSKRVIINEEYREGLKPLLTKEETHESAINSIIRQRTRIKFEPKIGKLTYAFGKYKNLSRYIIPIDETIVCLYIWILSKTILIK